MSQRVGRQRQNSEFFTPNPQGNSRLELQYRQPVMNGAGAVVNESQIVQAQVGHAVAIIRLRKEVGTLLRSREAPPTLDAQQSRWLTERVHSRSTETANPAQPARDIQQVSGTRPGGIVTSPLKKLSCCCRGAGSQGCLSIRLI